MNHTLKIALLAAGTVAGYAGGFISMRHHMHDRGHRFEAFEHHVASVCVDAEKGQRPGDDSGRGEW